MGIQQMGGSKDFGMGTDLEYSGSATKPWNSPGRTRLILLLGVQLPWLSEVKIVSSGPTARPLGARKPVARVSVFKPSGETLKSAFTSRRPGLYQWPPRA